MAGLLSRMFGLTSAPKAALLPAHGYEGARLARRLKGWNADRRNINALMASGGELLRARARQLCRENPYAANACEEFVAASVGGGIKPSSLVTDGETKKAIQIAWLRWTDEADADGLTDFYGLQALASRAMFEAGECFIRFRPRRVADGLSVPLQLQLLESEHLPFSHNEARNSRGTFIRTGIEFDGIGRRVAYHFLRNHPGDSSPFGGMLERTVVPASEVMHLYRPLRPGQIRGQPGITPAMVRLYLLDQYDDAELDRKRVAAMFAGFITKPRAEDDAPLPTESTDGPTALAGLEPGTLQVLLEGEDIKFSNPSEVGGTYEAFQWRTLLAICAACGIPYPAVTGDTSKSNYSSSREAQVIFRRRMDQFQHMTLVYQFCRPVWQRWFETALLAGALPINSRAYARNPAELTAAKWIPPKWDWVDPLKDLQAEKLAVDELWKARSDVIEAGGFDPEEVDVRIESDQRREADLGLRRPSNSGQTPMPADESLPDRIASLERKQTAKVPAVSATA
jgi:lambda family phage portal protein